MAEVWLALRCSLAQGSAASDIVAEVYELSLLPLAIGLAVAFLAEVFRHGARLREDVEGLV